MITTQLKKYRLVIFFLLDDLAVMDMQDLVADRGQGGVVGDDHDRRPVDRAHFLQNLKDLLASLVVKGPGWLITQKKRRLFSQGPGNGHPLLLTTGELGREVVDSFFQANGG